MAEIISSDQALPMKHYPQAQSTFEPPLLAHNNHFLGDVFNSTDSDAPISAGFYMFKPGSELQYTYTYHEMKIILEGAATISDETGQEVQAKAGDVFYFPKGAVITFKTDKHCKAFYCGQRPKDGA